MDSLTPGDFLYQSDQELFLVVVEEKEDSYLLAAHGWRDIGKDRIEQYIDDSQSKIHRQSEIENLVEEEGDADDQAQFEELKSLFDVYEELVVEEDGPAVSFALEEK